MSRGYGLLKLCEAEADCWPCVDIIVHFPFHIPFYLPRRLRDATLRSLSYVRVISPRHEVPRGSRGGHHRRIKVFVRFNFPINFITAPLIADLFLLAISAIGREEVYEGTIGADNISPYDIVLVFLCLGYIAASMEAAGLIRWLAFKVLSRASGVGHLLFFYLYASFFGLGIFIGNDPIMVLFLSYMTRVTKNITNPRAWIHMQFAVANIATAILVSSNPTNLVLAGAFNIKFINYTANLIVPVIATVIALFPFLLYLMFADEALIPIKIEIHELSPDERAQRPLNPNLPNVRGRNEAIQGIENDQHHWGLFVEEVLNPFVDKMGALVGTFVMVATIVILLTLNAVYLSGGGHPDYWVALPAASITLFWDVSSGWTNRKPSREICRVIREQINRARIEREVREREAWEREERREMEEEEEREEEKKEKEKEASQRGLAPEQQLGICSATQVYSTVSTQGSHQQQKVQPSTQEIEEVVEILVKGPSDCLKAVPSEQADPSPPRSETDEKQVMGHIGPGVDDEQSRSFERRIRERWELFQMTARRRATVTSLIADAHRWSQETFPIVMAALWHLPFTLVPFTLSMFVLVQALINTGWVLVFAHGWGAWVDKTGTVGSIAGMGFLSVILCNVSLFDHLTRWTCVADFSVPSSQVRTLAPASFYPKSFPHGRIFKTRMVFLLAIAHSGGQYTAWRSVLITVHSVWLLVRRWLVLCGGKCFTNNSYA